MGKTITPEEAADKLGISPDRIRKLCRARRVVGARLVGRTWLIPEYFEIKPGSRGPALTTKK